jgi:FkbM family methyltransferase
VYGRGTGFYTLKSFVLSKYGIITSGVIDRIFNIPIYIESTLHANLSHYINAQIFRTGDVIIVSIGSFKIYQEVKQKISQLFNITILWAMEISEYHLSHAEPDFLNNIGYFLESNKELIAEIRSNYEDEKSRQVFDGVMEYFSGKDYILKSIPSDPLSTQYFPKDFQLPLGANKFINGGAYDGDTLRSLITNRGTLGEATICFEPDLYNFKKLTEYVSTLNTTNHQPNILCLPLGLGATCQKLRFNSGSAVNSSIDSNGLEELTVVSIDSILPTFQPTFINMDIEGSEEDALRGATNTLKNSKPDLALCIYHTPQQFLGVPRFLLDLQLGYKFRLRNYTGYPAETVLYATASSFIN